MDESNKIVMREIKLSKGKIALVDDEDFDSLNKWKWQATFNKGNWYAMRCVYFKKGTFFKDKGKRTNISMHRQIMNINDGKIKIDHADRNSLNNQKNNLRKSTSSQNNANRKSTGASKYLGVSLQTDNRRGYSVKHWRAGIKKDNKKYNLGEFPYTACGELLAAVMYDIKASQFHKEYANLNFK